MKGSRKHQATGAPKGGKRPGAGRPEGTPNTLGFGEVTAMRSCNLRVPEGATAEVKALAERALERIIHVMEEKVPQERERAVLAAATRIREEACGPLAQKVEHSGRVGLENLSDEQLEVRYRAIQEKLTTENQEPEPEAP